MPEADTLLVERPRDGVGLLRLNRPERRNALSTPLLQDVAAALSSFDADPAIRVAVITGNEKLFAAGADINELAASTDADPIETPRFLAWREIRAFSKPLLAAVEGWCLGAGAELMMCCDIVVAGRDAKFGQPETNLGIIPGAGGTATLTRLVGRALAMRMVLTGEPITAADALAAGLIAELAENGEVLDRALDLGATIAARAPNALREAKASVRQSFELGETDHIRDERRRFISLLSSAEKSEGIAAFREKRPPRWPR